MRPPSESQLAAILVIVILHLFPLSVLGSRDKSDVSGLKIKVTHEVECDRKTHKGDTITVHYTGKLQQGGKQFGSSYDNGQPMVFRLGAGQVIQGWDLGLKNMCIGEERKLVLSPDRAYGYRAHGTIPPGSTLVFFTKLMAIEGVDYTAPDPPPPSDSHNHDKVSSASQNDNPSKPTKPPVAAVSALPDAPEHPTATPEADHLDSKPVKHPHAKEKPHEKEGEDGECRLLGPFALVVQAGLGVLALFSLVWKRYRERPRRPFKIWFFDVSKQVVGSVLLHVLNLLMSMLSSADLDLAHNVEEASAQLDGSKGGRSINPCSFYLINIAIDTTIGIPILILLLRILHIGARLTPLARPIESIKSGYYGQPPRSTWWLKQCLIYFIGLVLMKLCVFFLLQILPWIAWVGDWALRWTEDSEELQIAFVMFIFPLCMNAIQYYIIDSFIKERAGGEHQALPTDDTGSDGPHGVEYHSVDDDSDRDSMDFEDTSKRVDISTKEADTLRSREEEELLRSSGSDPRS